MQRELIEMEQARLQVELGDLLLQLYGVNPLMPRVLREMGGD